MEENGVISVVHNIVQRFQSISARSPTHSITDDSKYPTPPSMLAPATPFDVAIEAVKALIAVLANGTATVIRSLYRDGALHSLCLVAFVQSSAQSHDSLTAGATTPIDHKIV